MQERFEAQVSVTSARPIAQADPIVHSASIVPGSYRWERLPVENASRSWELPVVSFEIRIESGTGPAVVELQLGTSGGEADPSAPSSSTSLQQAQRLDTVSFPVRVQAREGERA